MELFGVKVSGKEVMITGIFAGTLFFLSKKTLEKTVPEIAEKIDPVNPDNIFNAYFEKFYSALTGSEDTPGEDVYDGVQNIKKYFNIGEVVPEITPQSSQWSDDPITYDLDYGGPNVNSIDDLLGFDFG